MSELNNINFKNGIISPALQQRIEKQGLNPNPFLQNNETDKIELGNTKTKSTSELFSEFEKTKEQQGLTGKSWDAIKNFFHMKSGSNYVEKTLKKLEQGEIKSEEAKEILTKYQDGQTVCVDAVADIVSSIFAVGVFSFAAGGLGLPIALSLSFLTGAGIKAGGKCFGAKANNREYDNKNLLYDIVTGGVNGLLAPVTNGLGSNLTKTIGLNLSLGISGDVLKTGAKTTLKSILLNQSIDVTGGTIGKRAIAVGAGMALDGALGGTADNATRATLEGKSAKDVAKSAFEGFIGGLIMSPIIGGGFRIAGKLGKKISNKIFQNNAPNAPKIQAPDSDIDIPKSPIKPQAPDSDIDIPKPPIKPQAPDSDIDIPESTIKPQAPDSDIKTKPESPVKVQADDIHHADNIDIKSADATDIDTSATAKIDTADLNPTAHIQSEEIQKARIDELEKMVAGRWGESDGRYSDDFIKKAAREFSQEKYDFLIALDKSFVNSKNRSNLDKIPEILDMCDDEKAAILRNLINLDVVSTIPGISSSDYQMNAHDFLNASKLDKEKLSQLSEILLNQPEDRSYFPYNIIGAITELNSSQIETFKKFLNIPELEHFEQFKIDELKQIALDMPTENLEYIDNVIKRKRQNKLSANKIKEIIEKFSKCPIDEAEHLEKKYNFLLSDEYNHFWYHKNDNFINEATDKELELAQKLLSIKNDKGKYVLDQYYSTGIFEQKSLIELMFAKHSEAKYELLDELLKYNKTVYPNDISSIFIYFDDNQAKFLKKYLYIEGRPEGQQLYNDSMLNFAHIKPEKLDLLEKNGLMYVAQRGENQFDIRELSALSELDEQQMKAIFDRNLLTTQAPFEDYKLDGSSIAEYAKISNENWEKAKELMYLPQRGKDSQLSANDIAELVDLDDIEFQRAKKLLFIEDRKYQFNVDSLLELAKLSDDEIEIAQKRGLLANSSFGGKDIKELLTLSDTDFNRSKEIVNIQGRKFNGAGLKKLTENLTDDELKKVPYIATVLEDGRYNEQRAQFSIDEIITLAKLPKERFKKLEKFFNFSIEERTNFNHDEIVSLLELSDDELNKAIALIKIPERPTFSQFNLDTIKALAKLPKENLDSIRDLFKIEGRIELSTYDIEKLTTLSLKELETAKKLAFIPDRGDYSQFNGDDLVVLSKLSPKELKKAQKYFYIPSLYDRQLNGSTIKLLQRYEGIKSFEGLTIAQKRMLLKDLIKENTNLFNTNIDYLEIANCGIIPRNKEEYCSLLPRLVKSIGISTNELTPEVKANFYGALSSIEAPNSSFRNFDFENPNFKIDLTYPRKQFVSDISQILKPLTKEQRNIVCNYFGFEIISNEGRYFMNGYPVNLNNGVELAKIDDVNLKQIIEQMRPLVKKFSENNTVSINGEPQLSKEINDIIKAFPEFITEIGKKQHATHDYTLDVHSLKVLQEVMNNPRYQNLSDKDKFTLKIAALLHDITKQENLRDVMHPQESAFDIYYLLDKLKLPEDEKLQIYQIVKDHNWLQKYNIKDLNRRKTIAKDIAFDLRKGNSFEMASILTEADMQAVKRNGAFFDGYADILKQGEQEVGEYVRQIKQSAIHLPQTKLPKASELIVDGDKVKEVTTKLTNGTEIKNKVIYLEPNLDLSKYGFSDNLNSDDLNVLIHALNTGEQSTIFQALGQIDSDALLSTSYVNYGQGNYHAFRQQGFILDVDSDDINAGYFRDFGSGYGKTLDKLKENYLFNGSWSQFRTYCSEELKKLLNMDDIEYMKFYEQIKNKSITEIDKEYPQAAVALREFFKKMEGGKRRYGRQYNEMLITRPKIQGVFNYGKSNDISKIPEFLRIYAQENDLPIVYFGK